MRWIVICCYGYTSQRLENERMGYLQYLTTAVGYLNGVPSAHVILCGGITQEGRTVSEAADALAAMRDLGLRTYRHTIELEESSKNTEQNIAEAGKIIKRTQKDAGDTDETEIICDIVRRFRVWVSSWIIFRHLHLPRPWRILGLSRFDIHPQSQRWVQTKIALLWLIRPSLVLKRAGFG